MVLTVSGGPGYTVTVTVPGVVGLTADEAVKALHDAGISARTVYAASTASEYTVIAQSSPAGTEITGLQGTVSVDITVSRGPSYVEETEPPATSAPDPDPGTPAETAGP